MVTEARGRFALLPPLPEAERFVLCSQKTLKEEKTDYVHITGITTGKIVDFGIKDSNNMGAAMAPQHMI